VHSDEIIGQVLDPRGRWVVLLKRIWHGKVVLVHPEMLHLTDAVLEVVAKAEHVEADRRYPQRTHYCARDIGPSGWLVVVVSYEQIPARIITAFGRGKDPVTWNS
jgi:hypothetical protein